MKIESAVLVVFCISTYLWTEVCIVLVHSYISLFCMCSIICNSMCLHGLATCVVCGVCMVCNVRSLHALFAAMFAVIHGVVCCV